MSTASAWVSTVLLALGLILVLHFMGYDVTGSVTGALHGVERILGQPIAVD